MPATMTYSETLTVTSCWCGIRLAIPDNLYRYLQKSDKNHCYCPLGHTFVFSNTLEEQLEQAREHARKAREREGATYSLLKEEERSHAATRGHLTRAKKQVHRAEHGVCPHCNRSFQNLTRHMETKHKREIEAGT
jgi:DNA repair exonuclease SbcCD ATPase subunit